MIVIEFIKKLVSSNEYDTLKQKIDTKSIVKTKKLKLVTSKFIKVSDQDDFYSNSDQFLKYTEIRYWMELIEYDVECIHGCLIYLMYESNQESESTEKFSSILDSVEFSFFFDSTISKFYTISERVAQLINCAYSLELIENKLGQNGVSIKNVAAKLEEKKLSRIKEYILKIDQKSHFLRKTRNAVTHHFHPLNQTYVQKNFSDGVMHFNKAKLPGAVISRRSIINSIQQSYTTVNLLINEIVEIIIDDFKMDNVIVKNGEVVEVAQMKMCIER